MTSKIDRSIPQTGTVDDLREIVRTSIDPLDRLMVRMQLGVIDALFAESAHLGNRDIRELINFVGQGLGHGIWTIAEQLAANVDGLDAQPSMPTVIQFAASLMNAQQLSIQHIITTVVKPSAEPLN